MSTAVPFFLSIPHSGEKVPSEASWLSHLPEPILMCDVDRFVDRLYAPALSQLKIPFVKTEWHRYVVDLNRLPKDVDADSVEGNVNPSGTHAQGLHWVITTRGYRLMPKPISPALHEKLVKDYFNSFHDQVSELYHQFRKQGFKTIFHLDAHSMPSMGTSAHRDPGQRRADIVVSDFNGKSCRPDYAELVKEAYAKAGFGVGYNWPYVGGRVTQVYGLPEKGQNAIQVELNRALYMDEESKQLNASLSPGVQERLNRALDYIQRGLKELQE